MYVISISIDKREQEVPDIQGILTNYGKGVVARLGLHCCEEENQGLILVVYKGENIEEFVEELNTINNITVNYMEE